MDVKPKMGLLSVHFNFYYICTYLKWDLEGLVQAAGTVMKTRSKDSRSKREKK